jgi:hypothetical protein
MNNIPATRNAIQASVKESCLLTPNLDNHKTTNMQTQILACTMMDDVIGADQMLSIMKA